MKRICFALFLSVAAFACGDKKGGDLIDAGGDGDGNGGGDGGGEVDAMVPAGCTAPMPDQPQCSNCIDDDNDGTIDGYDIECSGPLDNDENSFATGIPGDNIDAINQDCFFDGNSGAGNDGCNIHVCCLLGAQTVQDCMIGANQYDPMECPPPIGNTPLAQQCVDVCAPLTPPGCDCFGCCTLCNDTGCYDVLTNPSTSPNCNSDNLQDPAACARCTKVTTCGDGTCGGDTCILCPGQSPDDLPAECNMMQACPNNEPSCAGGEACPSGSYCSNGCCIGEIL